MMKYIKKEYGFTLIEIMVSMVISSLVIAGVYGVYTIQQRSYTVQEQVSEMQQRIRAAIDFMSREMRMAGYNPPDPYDPGDMCAGAGISEADDRNFKFTYCDVTKNEDNSYSSRLIENNYTFYDAYNDNSGTPDAVGLLREIINPKNPSAGEPTIMPIAEGVDAIEFQYLGQGGAVLPAPVDRTSIRAVEISMLVRSTYPDMKHTDIVQYTPRSGNENWISENPPNDRYHRRLLITTIYLRNMGVQQ